MISSCASKQCIVMLLAISSNHLYTFSATLFHCPRWTIGTIFIDVWSQLITNSFGMSSITTRLLILNSLIALKFVGKTLDFELVSLFVNFVCYKTPTAQSLLRVSSYSYCFVHQVLAPHYKPHSNTNYSAWSNWSSSFLHCYNLLLQLQDH